MLPGGDEGVNTEQTERALERIAALEPELHAFRSVRLKALQEAARGAVDGPLAGVPIAVKENIAVAGEATGHGTARGGPIAPADAEAVRRLRAAGALVVGTTVMPELALWPWTDATAN